MAALGSWSVGGAGAGQILGVAGAGGVHGWRSGAAGEAGRHVSLELGCVPGGLGEGGEALRTWKGEGEAWWRRGCWGEGGCHERSAAESPGWPSRHLRSSL